MSIWLFATMDDIESKQDVLTCLNLLLKPFSYDVFDKISAHNQKFQQFKTIVIWIEFVYSILISFIPTRYTNLLIILVDTGYYVIGTQLRTILNSAGFCYRINLVMSQTAYLFDNHRWLILANEFFHKSTWIQITEKMIHQIRFYKFIVRISGVFYYFICLSIFLSNTEVIEQINLENFHKFLFGFILLPMWLSYHFFNITLFYMELYLLLQMSTQFCTQFNTNFQLTLKKATAKADLIECIEHFGYFYLMIKNFNLYLTRAFILMVIALFGYSLHLFYLAFYSDLNTIVRYAFFLIIFVEILLTIYFAIIAETIDFQSKKMSTFVYKTIVIDQTITIGNYPYEVCC